jgi:hypothetical protein
MFAVSTRLGCVAFVEELPSDHEAAFVELCGEVGVDPARLG